MHYSLKFCIVLVISRKEKLWIRHIIQYSNIGIFQKQKGLYILLLFCCPNKVLYSSVCCLTVWFGLHIYQAITMTSNHFFLPLPHKHFLLDRHLPPCYILILWFGIFQRIKLQISQKTATTFSRHKTPHLMILFIIIPTFQRRITRFLETLRSSRNSSHYREILLSIQNELCCLETKVNKVD